MSWRRLVGLQRMNYARDCITFVWPLEMPSKRAMKINLMFCSALT